MLFEVGAERPAKLKFNHRLEIGYVPPSDKCLSRLRLRAQSALAVLGKDDFMSMDDLGTLIGLHAKGPFRISMDIPETVAGPHGDENYLVRLSVNLGDPLDDTK